MSSQMNVFLTEGNVEIYLSKLHLTWKPEERDKLLRLLAREEEQMGASREHLDHAERRIVDGRERIDRQRDIVACLTTREQANGPAALLLETLQQTQALLEQHLKMLRQRHADSKL